MARRSGDNPTKEDKVRSAVCAQINISSKASCIEQDFEDINEEEIIEVCKSMTQQMEDAKERITKTKLRQRQDYRRKGTAGRKGRVLECECRVAATQQIPSRHTKRSLRRRAMHDGIGQKQILVSIVEGRTNGEQKKNNKR